MAHYVERVVSVVSFIACFWRASSQCANIPEITIGLIADLTKGSNNGRAMAVATVMWDLDFRKNYDPAIKTMLEQFNAYHPAGGSFGDPVFDLSTIPGGLNPCLRVRMAALHTPSTENVGGNRQTEFALWSALALTSGENGMPKVHGLLSDSSSSLQPILGSFAMSQGMPLLSVATGVELDNAERYPYFFRMAASDSLQTQFMMYYIEYYEFRSFILLYPLTSHGQGVFDSLSSRVAAKGWSNKMNGIAVQVFLSSEDAALGHDLSQSIAAEAVAKGLIIPSRLIITAAGYSTLIDVMQAEGMWTPKYQILGSSAVFATKYFPTVYFPKESFYDITHMPPHIVILVPTPDALYYNALYSWTIMNNQFLSDDQSRYYFDKWHPELMQYSPPQFDAAEFGKAPTTWEQGFIGQLGNMYYAYIMAFNSLMNQGVAVDDMRGQTLVDALKAVELAGFWNPIKFDPNTRKQYQTWGIWQVVACPVGIPCGVMPIVAEYDFYGQLIAAGNSMWIGPFSLDGPGQPATFTPLWCNGVYSSTAPDVFKKCQPGMQLTDAGICQFCSPGWHSSGFDDECQICGQGTIPNSEGSACVACPKGYASPDPGSVECTICSVGTFTDTEGSTQCPFCLVGSYAASQGMLECTSCAAGETTLGVASVSSQSCVCEVGAYQDGGACVACPQYSTTDAVATTSAAACFCEQGFYMWQDAGVSQCQACPVNATTVGARQTSSDSCACAKDFYMVEENNNLMCNSCPALSSTLNGGSIGLSACRCEEGSYMNDGVCVACPAGSDTDTFGKTSVASCLCMADFYMPVDKSGCTPCMDGMNCLRGSSASNYNSTAVDTPLDQRTAEQIFPRLARGYYSDLNDEYGPMSVFKCRDEMKCPGGDPGTDACAAYLTGRACEHCEKGYSWDGNQCQECSDMEASAFLFPVLPLFIVPILILGMYNRFGDAYGNWGSWKNALGCMVFIMLNHYQILDFIGGVNVTFPETMSDAFKMWTWTNNFATIFKVECAGAADFKSSMLTRGIAPVLVVVVALLCYFTSCVLKQLFGEKKFTLAFDRLANVVGSLMYTFFSAVSAIAFMLFKCGSNPNGLVTNSSDMSIVCFESDTWSQLLGISVVFVIVYVLGLGSVFAWAVVMAPRGRFASRAFQMRWKFLFIKYHHEAYFWGIVFLLKNLALNLCFVVVSNGIQQLFLTQATLMLYTGGVYLIRPYRNMACNTLEMVVSCSLILATTILVWFAGKAYSSDNFDSTIVYTQMVVSFGPAGLGLAFMAVLAYQQGLHQAIYQQQQKENLMQVVQAVEVMSNMNPARREMFWKAIGEWDRHVLMKTKLMLNAELSGLVSLKRLTPKVEFTDSLEGNATLGNSFEEIKEINGDKMAQTDSMQPMSLNSTASTFTFEAAAKGLIGEVTEKFQDLEEMPEFEIPLEEATQTKFGGGIPMSERGPP